MNKKKTMKKRRRLLACSVLHTAVAAEGLDLVLVDTCPADLREGLLHLVARSTPRVAHIRTQLVLPHTVLLARH